MHAYHRVRIKCKKAQSIDMRIIGKTNIIHASIVVPYKTREKGYPHNCGGNEKIVFFQGNKLDYTLISLK